MRALFLFVQRRCLWRHRSPQPSRGNASCASTVLSKPAGWTLRGSTWITASCIGLAACASPPLHYYTLLAPADATHAAASGNDRPAPFDFAIASVRVPPQADQTSLVLRQSSGQLEVLDNDHWGAPLGEELRSAFSASLAHALGASDVSAVARDPARRVLQLALDVQRFELVTGRSATLEVTWSARQATAVPSVLTCTAASTQAASGPGIEPLAAAQQRAVRAVAAQIGTTLVHWNATGEVRCERQDLPTVPSNR